MRKVQPKKFFHARVPSLPPHKKAPFLFIQLQLKTTANKPVHRRQKTSSKTRPPPPFDSKKKQIRENTRKNKNCEVLKFPTHQFPSPPNHPFLHP